MSVKSGWNIKYNGKDGVSFYSLTSSVPGSGLLMFSKVPSQLIALDEAEFLKSMAEGFQNKYKGKGSIFTLTKDTYDITEIETPYCKGKFVAFNLRNNTLNQTIVQTVFVLRLDGELWNGQFTGHEEEWLESISMLKTLKRPCMNRLSIKFNSFQSELISDI